MCTHTAVSTGSVSIPSLQHSQGHRLRARVSPRFSRAQSLAAALLSTAGSSPRRVRPASRPSLTSSFPVSRPCSYCFSGCGCSTPLSPGWASCLQNPFSDVPPASWDGRSLALPDVHSARVLVLNPAEE